MRTTVFLALLVCVAAGQDNAKPNPKAKVPAVQGRAGVGSSFTWLAGQQDPAGAWKVGSVPSVGASALSVLAYLGAGYSDRIARGNVSASAQRRKYALVVHNGLRYL